MDTINPKKKYLDIKRIILAEIESNTLRVHSKLPSIDQMTTRYGVSKNTVLAALNILISENYIYSKSKVGYFVAEKGEYSKTERHKKLADSYIKISSLLPIKTLSEKTVERHYSGLVLSQTKDQTMLHSSVALVHKSFGADKPIKKSFKYLLKNQLVTDFMGFMNMYGLQELREEWIKYLHHLGVNTELNNTLIGGPNPRLFGSIFFLLLSKNVEIMSVYPSRLSIRSIVPSLSSKVLHLECDDEGITIESLTEQFNSSSKQKLLYIETVGAIHKVTQTTKKRIEEIYEFCTEKNIIVIENDYRDYLNISSYPKPMKAIDRNEIVIYVNAFEALLNPSGHCSIAVASPYLIKNLAYTTFQLACMPSSLSQVLTYNILQMGYFRSFIDGFLPKVKRRIKDVEELLTKYLADFATWYYINARFTVWITFKHSIKTDMLAINYTKVIYDECKIFGKKYDDSISIIITSGTIHDIEELIKEIRDAIRKVYFI